MSPACAGLAVFAAGVLGLAAVWIASGIRKYIRAQRLHAAKVKALEQLARSAPLAKAHCALRRKGPEAQA